MLPVFNRKGETIAWIKNDVIYSKDGRQAKAFISNNNVFTYSRNYVGIMKNGYFRDKNGHAVAFISGATGGPILPITKIPPIPPIAAIPPIKPIPPIPPIPRIPTLQWSKAEWEAYISNYT